jgi:hypothetical protein
MVFGEENNRGFNYLSAGGSNRFVEWRFETHSKL